MFSHVEVPPFERGMTWSTVRFALEPQYWHCQPSRAKTARRVILRRCVSRGTFTKVTSRMTIGRASVVVSECSSHEARSMTSAFSLSSSTTARRTVQTLTGSYVAFSTSTRPLAPLLAAGASPGPCRGSVSGTDPVDLGV